MTLHWYEIEAAGLVRRRFIEAHTPGRAIAKFRDVHVSLQSQTITARRIDPVIARQLGLRVQETEHA